MGSGSVVPKRAAVFPVSKETAEKETTAEEASGKRAKVSQRSDSRESSGVRLLGPRVPASPELARSDSKEVEAEEVPATEGGCEHSDTAATCLSRYEGEEEEPEVSSSTPEVELIAEPGANTSTLVEALMAISTLVVQEASIGIRLTYLLAPSNEITVSTTINSSKSVEAAMQAIGSSACWFVVDADGRRSLVDGKTPMAQLVGAEIVRYHVSTQRQALAGSAAEPAKSPPPPKTPPEGPPVDSSGSQEPTGG